MNGIHDLGGMDGFGSVDTDEHPETFHEAWEGVAYALFVAALGNGVATIDAFRHSIERMPPRDYLEASYYDRWVTAVTRLCVEAGVVDPAALLERTRAFEAGEASVPEREAPALLEALSAGVAEAYGGDYESQAPRFDVGEAVVVRPHVPTGHTRCPGYVRRAQGTVTELRGTHAFPDARAHGEDRAEPLYEVTFEGADLWGDARPSDGTRVSVDLWEPYLRPAAPV